MPTESDPPRTDPSASVPIAPGIFVRPGGLRIQFARSGGPGGQNVNKLNTKAELWIKLDCIAGLSHRAMMRLRDLAGNRLTQADEIHFRAEAERSQEANRQAVLDRLREMIVLAKVEPKLRRKTKPTRGSKLRRLDSKRRRSDIKSKRSGASDD